MAKTKLTTVRVKVMLDNEYDSYVSMREKAGLPHASKQAFCDAFAEDILNRYLHEEYMDPDFYNTIE